MRVLLFGLFCATFIGCGNGLATVNGVVTLDGKPLSGNEHLRGTVKFSSEDGHGNMAIGYLDENGRYELTSGSRIGLIPGKYLVTISAVEIIPSKIPGGAPSGRAASPARYADAKTSGLTADVAQKHNTFDYALSSAKNP